MILKIVTRKLVPLWLALLFLAVTFVGAWYLPVYANVTQYSYWAFDERGSSYPGGDWKTDYGNMNDYLESKPYAVDYEKTDALAFQNMVVLGMAAIGLFLILYLGTAFLLHKKAPINRGP